MSAAGSPIPIPRTAHFVWVTPGFPWLNVVALRSALLHGGFERVVLHHTHDLEPETQRVLEGVECRRIVARETLLRLASALGQAGAERLCNRYRELEKPAAQSNLLRIAIITLEGGVYLDLDTVTVRSLEPICAEGGAFCGAEHIAFPAEVLQKKLSFGYSAALARSGARAVLRSLPEGWRWFRRVEHLYPRGLNNAVLGAVPGHPLMLKLLERALGLPREHALRRYALGTHLLQAVARDYRGADFIVYPPSVFYPLGPVISQHWFRKTPDPTPERFFFSDTRVVHWYASLRTQRQQRALDRDGVARLAAEQPLSALALAYSGTRH